mmetsp:Transcript_40222/g.67406  ORF Transcript_40222/g.67406 Transcript_40222/m.67406 type:complete len:390 (-) Transcript_40222:47-1216(-)
MLRRLTSRFSRLERLTKKNMQHLPSPPKLRGCRRIVMLSMGSCGMFLAGSLGYSLIVAAEAFGSSYRSGGEEKLYFVPHYTLERQHMAEKAKSAHFDLLVGFDNRNNTSYIANSSIGTGDFNGKLIQAAVMCPPGINYNDWLKANMVDLYNDIGCIVHDLKNDCTERACPTMRFSRNQWHVHADVHGRDTYDSAPSTIDAKMSEAAFYLGNDYFNLALPPWKEKVHINNNSNNSDSTKLYHTDVAHLVALNMALVLTHLRHHNASGHIRGISATSSSIHSSRFKHGGLCSSAESSSTSVSTTSSSSSSISRNTLTKSQEFQVCLSRFLLFTAYNDILLWDLHSGVLDRWMPDLTRQMRAFQENARKVRRGQKPGDKDGGYDGDFKGTSI